MKREMMEWKTLLTGQHNRRTAQDQCQKCQQRTRPVEPQPRIHTLTRKWQERRSNVLSKTHSCCSASSVFGVRVRYVHRDGLHDHYAAKPDEQQACGGSPVAKIWIGSPAVDEKATYKTYERCWDGEVEPHFRQLRTTTGYPCISSRCACEIRIFDTGASKESK